MNLVDIFVAACFALGVLSALCVALHPNVLYAAIALVFSLLSVAGLYGALGADFLAAAQLIIYVGGIIVVILFAIMMSENIYRRKFLDVVRSSGSAAVVFCVVLWGLFKLNRLTDWTVTGAAELSYSPTSEAMGRALVGPYALIFQYVAIVLLAGLIGAIVVARPHYHEPHGEKKKQGGGHA